MSSAGLRKTRRPLVARGATAGRQHGCPFDTVISPGPWTCRLKSAGVQDGERASSRSRQGVEFPSPARSDGPDRIGGSPDRADIAPEPCGGKRKRPVYPALTRVNREKKRPVLQRVVDRVPQKPSGGFLAGTRP